MGLGAEIRHTKSEVEDIFQQVEDPLPEREYATEKEVLRFEDPNLGRHSAKLIHASTEVEPIVEETTSYLQTEGVESSTASMLILAHS